MEFNQSNELENHTQTGKRVVNISIILSYWFIPPEELLGRLPDTFADALQQNLPFLITAVNDQQQIRAIIAESII